MFKKAKKDKYSPPAPPTAEEILQDMTTFNVPVDGATADVKTGDWWAQFELFTKTTDELMVVQDLMTAFNLKLTSTKMEIETEAKQLRGQIDEQQQLATTALK